MLSLSSLDDRVRTKRFYFQPGEHGYRVEALVEAEGWTPARSFHAPPWRIARGTTVAAAAESHYDHLARAFHIPRWDARPDVPDWLRQTALVVTLHGMHYSGYVFNDYARMLAILQWMATRMPAGRVLVFLASWDGRYYWDYPLYQPSDRMGGEAGFRTLIEDAQRARLPDDADVRRQHREPPSSRRLRRSPTPPRRRSTATAWTSTGWTGTTIVIRTAGCRT